MKVYFIGAGPGDPELLTIKGKEILEQAEIVVYAGSLVNKEILKYAVNSEETHNSASLNLEEIESIFKRAKESGKNVARLHTGDPSIYGAINEQMVLLDNLHIEYEVIPGISSFQAAAAALRLELTVPEVCQTITISRVKGRTPVPEKEDLKEIIRTRPTLFLYLSINMLNEIVETLKTAYSPETPVIIAYKVSWPDEEIIQGTLENILKKTAEKKITKTALILIGEALLKKNISSKLYDKNFSHEYRS
ncbi:MAG TPA: precorrin-4 C(11)-methyltransferase [Nitrospinota bacterium]|jgi:precorrin-4/cobalt-precorrin-4 C11-methyltransferase|nr:precorrin-4 C(11)-methyltransferase [Nitrospinota bacterium]